MDQRHTPGNVAAIFCNNVDRDPIQISGNDALEFRSFSLCLK